VDKSVLRDANILLGVSGGISAYKSVDLCRLIMKAGGRVRVVMTASAAEFITPLTLETLSGNPVYHDMFDQRRAWEIEHISFARWGQALLIAPATANILAKMAAGLADDPLSTTFLAFRGPVIAAPAMNTAMWEHPQTRENLAKLRARGVHIVEPASGTLACGEEGAGKLAVIETVFDALCEVLARAQGSGPLAGKRVLITAGPTVEALDPVRFLSNPSSGRMGFALAREARLRGAAVTLIHGPVAIEPPEGLARVVPVRSAREMNEAVQRSLEEQDICVFCAAVADYTPETPSPVKIKKEGAPDTISLRLTRTPDVAREAAARRRPGQIFVGFAAETNDLEANARRKMESKGFDVVVANEVSAENPAFGARENRVLLLARDGDRAEPARADKNELAGPVWDFIQARRSD
jgi:phosphopantothenoylcysteine decarboxylase/phosphopantothenate--cysteine ligase